MKRLIWILPAFSIVFNATLFVWPLCVLCRYLFTGNSVSDEYSMRMFIMVMLGIGWIIITWLSFLIAFLVEEMK